MMTDEIRPINEDHPVIQMLVADIVERQERFVLGTFTVRDIEHDTKNPPFVFLIDTHDIDEEAGQR